MRRDIHIYLYIFFRVHFPPLITQSGGRVIKVIRVRFCCEKSDYASKCWDAGQNLIVASLHSVTAQHSSNVTSEVRRQKSAKSTTGSPSSPASLCALKKKKPP